MELLDACQQWLGISPAERPITHYRLLGISNFESNSDVIRSAVQQRTRLLGSHQLGPDRDVANKLLQEVAKASTCLLSPPSKADYDQTLRARLTATAPKVGQPAPQLAPQQTTNLPALEPAKPLINTGSAASGANSSRSRSTTTNPATPVWQRPAVIIPAAAAAVGVLMVLIMVVAMRPKKTEISSISQPRRTASSDFSASKKPANKPPRKPTSELPGESTEQPSTNAGEHPVPETPVPDDSSETTDKDEANSVGDDDRFEKPPRPDAPNPVGPPGSKPSSDPRGNPVGGSGDSSTRPGPTSSDAATDEVVLDFGERFYRRPVELPEGVNTENVALKITDVRRFPPTKMITPNSTAKVSKDVIFALLDDSSNVKFRVRVTLREEKLFIQVSSTYSNITKKASPLTKLDLNRNVVATKAQINKDERELVFLKNALPTYNNQVVFAMGLLPPARAAVETQKAQTRVTKCRKRINALQGTQKIPGIIQKDKKRLERLEGLQEMVERLHGIAVVEFELVSLQPKEDE